MVTLFRQRDQGSSGSHLPGPTPPWSTRSGYSPEGVFYSPEGPA